MTLTWNIVLLWIINPLTTRCAEFSHWLQRRTIYRKKRWTRIGNSISCRFWRRPFESHSQNSKKMTLDPLFSQKYLEKTLFLDYVFFQSKFKLCYLTCSCQIYIEMFGFSLFSNSKWLLDVLNFLKLKKLLLFRIFHVTS